MPTVTITGATRRGDEVLLAGTVDGAPARARIWWSHLVSLTAAQRRAAIAQALAADAAAQADVDLGLTGTVTV